MPIVSIDPGLSGTGMAYFRSRASMPTTCTIYPNPHDTDWIQKMVSICNRLLLQIPEDVDTVYCEMAGEQRSVAGRAASAKGDVHKLAALIGAITYAVRMAGKDVVIVPVCQWKGNLPKTVTRQRIERILGVRANYFPSHASDAVGIGLWALGRFGGSSHAVAGSS